MTMSLIGTAIDKEKPTVPDSSTSENFNAQ